MISMLPTRGLAYKLSVLCERYKQMIQICASQGPHQCFTPKSWTASLFCWKSYIAGIYASNEPEGIYFGVFCVGRKTHGSLWFIDWFFQIIDRTWHNGTMYVRSLLIEGFYLIWSLNVNLGNNNYQGHWYDTSILEIFSDLLFGW